MHLLMHEPNCFTVALGAAGSSRVFLGVSGRARAGLLALTDLYLCSPPSALRPGFQMGFQR
jgi:hypothetical protein